MRQTYESSLAPDGSAIAFIVRDSGYPRAVQQEITPEGLGEERPVKLPVEGPVTRVLHSRMESGLPARSLRTVRSDCRPGWYPPIRRSMVPAPCAWMRICAPHWWNGITISWR